MKNIKNFQMKEKKIGINYICNNIKIKKDDKTFKINR